MPLVPEKKGGLKTVDLGSQALGLGRLSFSDCSSAAEWLSFTNRRLLPLRVQISLEDVPLHVLTTELRPNKVRGPSGFYQFGICFGDLFVSPLSSFAGDVGTVTIVTGQSLGDSGDSSKVEARWQVLGGSSCLILKFPADHVTLSLPLAVSLLCGASARVSSLAQSESIESDLLVSPV